MGNFLPLHRLFGATLIALICAFIVWACFGHLDIVATGSGKLVPATFVKVSQPAENGIIRDILVKDGERVEAGQPLLKLDSVYAESEAAQAQADVAQLQLRLNRIDAERQDTPFSPENDNAALVAAVRAEYLARRDAYRTALRDAEFALKKADSDVIVASERMAKLAQTAPLAADQSNRMQALDKEGHVSHANAVDKLSAKLDLEGELATQKRSVESARYAKAQAAEALRRVTTEYHKTLGQERTETQANLDKALAELKKREYRVAEMTLKAPVAGFVNALQAKTVGQVVQAGAVLLSIVPEKESLIAEAWLKNEDAPYVAPGMPVKVKLAAYPFQKYGWLEGEVTWIGADSETPETMRNTAGEPLFYKTRVALKAQELTRDGKAYPAKVGMQAVTDIQIGDRTLIEYLTSPLKKVLLEAAREK